MLPITGVTLYTSGVGYFERGGEVDGEASLTLLFPVGQVNDVLKSLVLLDGGGGTIQPVTYAAQDPVRKALQAFSIDVSDNPDRPTLLNRMRGTSVTLTTDNPAPLTGVILGVETQTILLPDDQGTSERHTLSLLAGDALHSVPLESLRSLQINDASLADELRQALATVAQGRDASKRPITLTFSGEGVRAVRIGYLRESPAWQTSYRLVLGQPSRLQGWALVQNTGQDDWTDTHLTLVSGRPISFIQDLYTPLYVHRPTVQPRIPASPTPQTYASDLMSEDVLPAAPMAVYPMAAAPAPSGVSSLRYRKAEALSEDWRAEAGGGMSLDPSQAAQQSMAASGAELGTALFAYHIDVPVTVPRQQSAMIPFVAAEVEAERVSVYNSSVHKDHPLSGVRLKNTTNLHLMGGPLTVFETQEGQEAGYVGDALVDDTEPGQSRLLTYALDLAVDADAQRDTQSGTVTEIRITEGALRVRQSHLQVARYTFKNNSSQPRNLIVEYPIQPEWTLLEPKAPDERTATHYRFGIAAPASASVILTVHTERQVWESFRLLDASPERFLFYGRSGSASDAIRAALEDITTRREKIARIEADAFETDRQLQAISGGQERIRKNMEALDHKSDLYRRYVGELDKQETQIADLTRQNEARQAELAQARAELSAYIAKIEM